MLNDQHQDPTYRWEQGHPSNDPLAQLARIPSLAQEARLTYDAPNPAETLAISQRGATSSKPPAGALALIQLDDGPHSLLNLLTGAAAIVEVWAQPDDELPESDWVPVCNWLMTHHDLWAQTEYAKQITDRINDVCTTLAGLTRQPITQRWRCPIAGCGAVAHLDATWERGHCDNGHDLVVAALKTHWLDSQDWTLRECRENLARWYQIHVPIETLRTWAKRHEIRPVGTTSRGEPLYSFRATSRRATRSKLKRQ